MTQNKIEQNLTNDTDEQRTEQLESRGNVIQKHFYVFFSSGERCSRWTELIRIRGKVKQKRELIEKTCAFPVGKDDLDGCIRSRHLVFPVRGDSHWRGFIDTARESGRVHCSRWSTRVSNQS